MAGGYPILVWLRFSVLSVEFRQHQSRQVKAKEIYPNPPEQGFAQVGFAQSAQTGM